MKQHALAILLAVTVGACGGDKAADTIAFQSTTSSPAERNDAENGPPMDVESSTTSTTTASAGQDDLDRMALMLTDMPSGWSESTPESSDEDSSDFCVDDANDLVDSETWPRLDRDFSAGAFGPFLSHSLMAAPDERSATNLVEQFAELAEQCQTWTDEDGSYSLSPVNYPEVGDQTFAVRLTVESDGFTFLGDVIVIRESNVLSMLLPIGVASPVEAETVVAWMKLLEARD